MDETTTAAPRCAWSGDAGELRKDAAGSRVVCDQREDASNHQHSMLCPRDHAEELICHRFVAAPASPSHRESLERILALQPEAAAIMRHYGFVIDLWPPAGVDRPADHLSELDEPTRWQGLAFSLYTALVEASSLAEQMLGGGDD
jgi:hypothetical protein